MSKTKYKNLPNEEDAVRRMTKAASGPGIRTSEPVNGIVYFISSAPGLLKVNKEAILKINRIDGFSFSTFHGNITVKQDTSVAFAGLVPFAAQETNITEAETICSEHYPVIEVKSFRNMKVGIILTGNEIYSGRIEDKFSPILEKKFRKLNCSVLRRTPVPDDIEKTVSAINELIEDGAELIALTGGMSVDPDDLTPASIRKTGAEIITYGVPVYPGGMFLLAYLGDIPVLGLPGCVMYHRASIFDLILPLIVAGETVTRDYVVSLGHGGFCSRCETCAYPLCGFGRQ